MGSDDRARAALWLQSLAGTPASVREARRLRLGTLCAATERQAALADSVQQIDKDLPRLAVREETREQVREVLLAWLALNNFVGYAQGMDMVCCALLTVYKRGRSVSPAHDALASLSAVAKINHGRCAPARRETQRPSSDQARSHSKFGRRCLPPRRQYKHNCSPLPQLQVFVLRAMPPCCNVVAQPELVCLWDYILLASPPLRPARCRHVTSALLLQHRRLFEFGKDFQQNFVIFQNLVRLTTPAQASKIVALARHLERVERLCGE